MTNDLVQTNAFFGPIQEMLHVLVAFAMFYSPEKPTDDHSSPKVL
jgi:hypothetical protein